MQGSNILYQEAPDKLNAKRVAQFIRHHSTYQLPRLVKLDEYYQARDTAILTDDSRRNEEGKADHRAVHSFAKYIADFHTAFSVGNPINIKTPKESERFDEFNKVNDIDAHNYDMFLDMTRYGRAYEYIYRGVDNIEHIVRLDPKETFVIYDKSVDPQPVMAVRYRLNQQVDVQGVVTNMYIVETWTDTQHTIYKPSLSDAELVVDDVEPQQIFPVVEYQNNTFRMGDYENVITLIDLYDASQSDTANYMTDLNEAMLVIKGDVDTLFDGSTVMQGVDPTDPNAMMKLAEDKLEMLKEMRQANMLLLKSGTTMSGAQTSVDAEYIHKEYDVNGAEAYKKRVAADIHKFSHTPDLTDEKFSGNSSGVAMKYKLLGTFELASTKRRQFTHGLYRRYSLVGELETKLHDKWDLDAGMLNFTYRDNLPTDDVTTIKELVDAGAQLPQKYLYQLLPNVTDPQDIIDMMEEQRKNPVGGFSLTNGGADNGTTDDDGDAEVRGQETAEQSDGSKKDNQR